MIKEVQKNLVVDRAKRQISNVSVLSLGLTLNDFSVDEITLSGLFQIAQGQGSFPVYIDHETEEKPHTPDDIVALLSAFHIENGIEKATLTFLQSFADSEADKYNRLMELAETAPEVFGLSIYYEGKYVTINADTSEECPAVKEDAPNEIFLRVNKLFSVDFVSIPGANEGLKKNPILSITQTTLSNLMNITLDDTQVQKLQELIDFLETLIPQNDEPAAPVPAEVPAAPVDEAAKALEANKTLSAKIVELETALKASKLSAGVKIDLGDPVEIKTSVKDQYDALNKKGDFKGALAFYRQHKNELK